MASESLTSDRHDRRLKDLRISVTDRCNFRCTYCMPDDEYVWFARSEILSFEEISRLARLFVALGVDKIRLTGGEPLIRRDLDRLVRQLAAIDGLQDLCLTTNGSLLAEKAETLAAAGLKRLNVSLDTLDPQKFARIRRRGDLSSVLNGLFAAKAAGFRSIKLNAVIERGVNEDDILPLVEFAREHQFTMRFIEYMDVGNANRWLSDKMVSKREILETIHARHPLREVGRYEASAPAVDYEFEDGNGTVGVIASVTEPFCGGCTRGRLTADGKLVTCLFAESGHDLKGLLRSGASDAEITQFIISVWGRRDDRYSEIRSEQTAGLPKVEMSHIGG